MLTVHIGSPTQGPYQEITSFNGHSHGPGPRAVLQLAFGTKCRNDGHIEAVSHGMSNVKLCCTAWAARALQPDVLAYISYR